MPSFEICYKAEKTQSNWPYIMGSGITLPIMSFAIFRSKDFADFPANISNSILGIIVVFSALLVWVSLNKRKAENLAGPLITLTESGFTDHTFKGSTFYNWDVLKNITIGVTASTPSLHFVFRSPSIPRFAAPLNFPLLDLACVRDEIAEFLTEIGQSELINNDSREFRGFRKRDFFYD